MSSPQGPSLGRILCTGLELFVKHFDVLGGGCRGLSKASLPPTPPALEAATEGLLPAPLLFLRLGGGAGAAPRAVSSGGEGAPFRKCVFCTPPPFPWCQRFASWIQFCSSLFPGLPLLTAMPWTSSLGTLLGADEALFCDGEVQCWKYIMYSALPMLLEPSRAGSNVIGR